MEISAIVDSFAVNAALLIDDQRLTRYCDHRFRDISYKARAQNKRVENKNVNTLDDLSL